MHYSRSAIFWLAHSCILHFCPHFQYTWDCHFLDEFLTDILSGTISVQQAFSDCSINCTKFPLIAFFFIFSASVDTTALYSEIMMYVLLVFLTFWLLVEMIYCYRKISKSEELAQDTAWVLHYHVSSRNKLYIGWPEVKIFVHNFYFWVNYSFIHQNISIFTKWFNSLHGKVGWNIFLLWHDIHSTSTNLKLQSLVINLTLYSGDWVAGCMIDYHDTQTQASTHTDMVNRHKCFKSVH